MRSANLEVYVTRQSSNSPPPPKREKKSKSATIWQYINKSARIASLQSVRIRFWRKFEVNELDTEVKM